MKGEIVVRYTIRHFDLPLLTFEANMDSADTDLHIIKVYEENRSFLPLNLTVSEDGVEEIIFKIFSCFTNNGPCRNTKFTHICYRLTKIIH